MGFHFGDAVEYGTLEIELHHHTQSLCEAGVHANGEIQSGDGRREAPVRPRRQARGLGVVVMEEAAIALFSALPEHFVLFGGATLVLFHESPRLSKDLDVLVRVDSLPTAAELEEALQLRLQEVAGLPSMVLAGIPGKASTQTGFGALTYTTSPATGLLRWVGW